MTHFKILVVNKMNKYLLSISNQDDSVKENKIGKLRKS